MLKISSCPNIMFISKKTILDKWFKDLFKWLFRCEKNGTKKLKGYDQKDYMPI